MREQNRRYEEQLKINELNLKNCETNLTKQREDEIKYVKENNRILIKEKDKYLNHMPNIKQVKFLR